MKHELSASDIQYYLWIKFHLNHAWLCPNVYLYRDWESDFISITKSGIIHEYEIKISKSDFKADQHKVEKHIAMQFGKRDPKEWEKRYREISEDGTIKMHRPNYFWYVCPSDLISVDDIPPYAGLIYIHPISLTRHYYNVEMKKNAPKLHKEKMNELRIKRLLASLHVKYWALRNKLPSRSEKDLWAGEEENKFIPKPLRNKVLQMKLV